MFHSRKCSWKCCLPDISHFVQTLMCYGCSRLTSISQYCMDTHIYYRNIHHTWARLFHILGLLAGRIVRGMARAWPVIGWWCLLYHWLIQIINWDTPHLPWIMDQLQCILGSGDLWEFPPVFKSNRQSPRLPLRLCKETVSPAVGAVQGDCGSVYTWVWAESIHV